MFSSSAVFIRWAAPLDPITISAARMTLGSLTVVVISLVLQRTWRPPPRSDVLRYVLYGLVAAVHFAFFVSSLAFTSIAHALSITYTAPIWVTVFGCLLTQECFPRHKWPAMAATIIGIGIMTGFEPVLDGRMLLGDLLALGSAISFGFYSVIGRSERSRASLFTYTATVYGVAGLWLMIPGWLAYEPGTLSWQAGLAVLGSSVLSLGFGHTLYNAALRKLHPTVVNVIAAQEVTGGVLLGVVFLGEIPGPVAIIGSFIAMGGVIRTLA
jgi:drug/metabolite transporter (DMT)-like permease